MQSKYNEAKEILGKYNQEQVLNFFDEITDEEKEKLLNQILSINFEQLTKLYLNKDNIIEEKGEISPITYIDELDMTKEENDKYIKSGSQVINER